MKTVFTPLILLLVFLTACTSSQKLLERGYYDQAVYKSVNKLRKNPDKEKQVMVLREAFNTANAKDQEQIRFLKGSGQPDIWDKIFVLYTRLRDRQEAVRYLPEPVLRKIGFQFVDYNAETVNAKQNAAEYFYQSGLSNLKAGDRFSARKAYYNFESVKQYYPNYRDVDKLMLEARTKGTANVLFTVANNSGQILPEGFVEEIYKIYLSDLNGLFVQFYSKSISGITIDYSVILNITNVSISPEMIREVNYDETKEIQDGWNYVLDSHGNVMKDTLGNDIKTPKMITLVCRVREFIMHKQSMVSGYVDFYNNEKMLLKSEPIAAENFFDYSWAIAQGDMRAIKPETLEKTKRRERPFPDNLMMVWDAQAVLKDMAKNIVARNANMFQ